MRLLIFHGYMLRGTGSNIYNARLAAALARMGHEVHLLCQDRRVRIDGVHVHNPDIGSLLPVYVKDPYEGFEVKTFQELTDAELERYLEANVAAVRRVAAAAGGIDAALANHLVMGPAILARAGAAPFAAKIHGSALEYTVKPHPRFRPFAREGMEAAAGVLVGSRHTAESLWAALPEVEDLPQRTRLGPPGVDVAEFHPAGRREPVVAFVGKLIAAKGADLLLAAWPLVRARNPSARLLVAGYGAYEPALRRLLAALERGDVGEAARVAALGRSPEGGEGRPLSILSSFFAQPPAGYAEAARAAAGSVELIGRLEHHQVAELLQRAEALAMPSTFPEAFGMVAVEAAACGALPISAGHSGMLEVSRHLAAVLRPGVRELTSFPVDRGAVEAIASRLNGWLALPEPEREAARRALAEAAARQWSWEAVARGVISAARGDLRELPLPE